MIHLYCHGYDGEELADFELRLSNPSTIAQQQKLELIRTRFEIAGTAPEGSVNRSWIQKNVLGLTEEEIKDVVKGRIQDKVEDAEVEAAATVEEEAGGAPAGGAEAGGEEGGLFAADEPAGELLTALPASGDGEEFEMDEDEDVILNLSIDDDDAPIKAQNAIMNAFGEPVQTRRVSRHGPASTHTPDFAKMTSVGRPGRGQDTMNQPFDDDFIKSPFKEAHDAPLVAPRLTIDLVKTLGHMSNKIGISKQTLLSESDEELSTRGEDHNGET
jgi:hypothetical protein